MADKKVVEIDEATWLAHQGVTTAVDQMLKDPEARRLLMSARQKVDPKFVPPETVALKPVEDKLAETQKTVAELRAEMAKDKAERESKEKIDAFASNWNKQKAEVREKFGLTDEGIAAIEKHAETEGIASFRAAANDWLALHPPAQPEQSSGYGAFNFFEPSEKEDDVMKKLLETRGQSEPLLNKSIREALDEVRGRRAA